MCLLVVAWQIIDDTPLLVGANRDEFLNRPTTTMTALRPNGPRVLGGRDEHSGGTWLAVNEHGVFGALTNQPLGDAKDLSLRSRGELPLALAGGSTATEGVENLLGRYRPEDYNGSWLMVGDRQSLYFVDFTGLVEPEPIPLSPGLHVLGNAAMGTPSTKVSRVHQLLDEMPTDAAGAGACFMSALGDHWLPAPDASAPETLPIVANCVHLEEYGTRSSCLVRVDDDPSHLPRISLADGPPCTTPFADQHSWWQAAS